MHSHSRIIFPAFILLITTIISCVEGPIEPSRTKDTDLIGVYLLETDLVKSNLKGNVKSIKKTKYIADNNGPTVSKGAVAWKSESLEDYDNDNYFEYNERGFLLKSTFYTMNRASEDFEYEYSGDTLLISMLQTVYSGVNEYNKTIYSYNDNSWIITAITKDKNESLLSTEEYERNDNGALLSIRTTYSDGYVSQLDYTNDQFGWILTSEYSWPKSKMPSVYKYSKNIKGVINSMTYENSSIKEIHSYDKFGNIIITETVVKSHTREYDRIPEWSYFDKYKYVYDEQGNWISKTILDKNKATHIYERVIEYYN